jgi:glycosyltransferase involved in cell wall biosynthesis
MSTTPIVSVVLATYNRSRVLAHAIDSVRASTLVDWELLVVGDHCTDDTAEVVASFDDPRITFVNLPRNAGEQSGPNNEGVRRARGRYIAYLNHDDMFFPDHLAASVAWRERTNADFVWSPMLMALPLTESEIAAGAWRFRLCGVPEDDRYHPRVFVFASAWLLTRELATRIGPWRPARETFATSSQDWRFRAFRAGADMRLKPAVSVLAVPGSVRAGSYLAKRSPEHDGLAAELRNNPRFRETAIESAAIFGEREANRYKVGRALRSLVVRPMYAAALSLGIHPYAPYFALRYGRRGNLVNTLRRRTGLGKLTH